MKTKLMFSILITISVILILGGICLSNCTTKSNGTSISKVENASRTDSKFYKKMVGMERGSEIVFDGFPTCLVDVFNALPGDEILISGKDTVSYVFRYFNRDNVNNYPFYVIKDNHGNVWSIYRHNELFRLIREDEKLLRKIKLNI